MRITLVQPAMGHDEGPFVGSWKMEPLAMATLASLTPPEHEVAFVDDRVETVDYDEPTDLAAISCETYTARRAYQIAHHFRERGVPVVMGGFHATLMEAEVAAHADAVVVGEAEPVWSQVLADAAAGALEPRYAGECRPDMVGLKPDRSIYAGKKYVPLTLVESGRGCQFACDFCAVTAYFKKSYRFRPPEEVAAEIARTGGKHVFLVDDNLTADFDRTKAMLRAIEPLKVRWMSQATIQTAEDPELLKLMQKSGCEAILVGFESLDEPTLRSMNKRFNRGATNYHDRLQRLRDHGIKVYATFVFGYDSDAPDVFERTLEFAMEQKFFVAAFNHLQPFPGTPLYARLESEGRLLYPKWWLEPSYRFGQVCFRPESYGPDELYDRLMQMRRTFFSVPNIFRRALEFRANLHGLRGLQVYSVVNALLRKEIGEKWQTPLGDLNDPTEIA